MTDKWPLSSTLLLMLVIAGVTGSAAAPIAVIIPAAEAPRLLTREDLVLIYTRKKLFWDSGKKIYPVNLPPAHALRINFSERLLSSRPEAMQQYWNDLYFHGVLPPHILSSEEAVQRFVANTPGAVGYVSYCYANTSARVSVILLVNDGGQISSPDEGGGCVNNK
jgi:ABC-type phosphate transport system substrate-binding protein